MERMWEKAKEKAEVTENVGIKKEGDSVGQLDMKVMTIIKEEVGIMGWAEKTWNN